MTEKRRQVHASVKDIQLIEKRRSEMIRGAVQLFKQKGFHRTTTREIAKASGFSIGTMYEYIRTKEDVLYLVCDSIYDQVKERLQQIDFEQGTLESLQLGITYYFRVMDEMQDEVLVMHQEVKSLSKDVLPYVLKKEVEMVSMMETLIQRCVDRGVLEMDEKKVHVLAQNIFNQGQMWGFRRWMIQKSFTLDEYINLQTDLLFAGINGYKTSN
ncbi:MULTISPECIES: TetR/AcrR family transcriptional regulator [Bacillaceae]|uniref:TetR family transcriptional regulator n=1 Tax=Domibacillus aminovorans TaxID=29332 RepID=A0A177L278_9BACI|nr:MULTISPECIES: TetR/AcrR family transcriptional regulator [Bacillaceae]OAH54408.1 TetR family transcriptional regulator [Domibacillus aminovorans]OAH58871.1 TetR family transcriptional regulator [Domibacillus aminovorans]